jgi:hypothetical protein
MISQSLAFYVDLHIALVVCLALYLYCTALARRDAQRAYDGLTVTLLAPSVKYSGIYFALVLSVATAYCLMRADAPRRPRARAVALLTIAVAFTGGWYVRNWLSRGNPIFPFDVPAWTRPVFALAAVPYESDPDHRNISPRTAWPHPWLPNSWLQHDYKPDMTQDAFGAAGVVAIVCTLVSLALLPRLPGRERELWVFAVVVTTLLVGTFPDRAQIPRYVLFAPILACLGPAVLARVAHGAVAQHAVTALCAGVLMLSASYAYVNLLAPGDEWTKLRVASSYLFPYRPHGLRQIGYAQHAHLRIGYTSGFGNLIALLYDPHLTNELIPLHYKDYPYNHGREFASAEEFVAHVRSLELDYVHVFDPRYPGVDLLRAHFPDKVMPR